MKLSFERVNTLLSKALKVEPLQLKSSFRPATEQDFEDIVEFRKNYFDEELPWDDRAYLRWRYDFGNDDLENRNIFWILKIDGELLGVIGTEFLELVVKGEITKAHHPLDILVKPELDGLGIGAWLSLAINEKYDVILAVGANENSKSLFKKMFHPMPDRRTWKLMIKSESFIRKYIASSLLVSLISLLLDLHLSVRRLMSRKPFMSDGAEIKLVERFNNDVDRWRLAYENSPSIYRLRSAQYLNWRFVDNPRRNYDILGLLMNGKLVAYIIYHTWSSSKQNHVSAGIDDFFWDSQSLQDMEIPFRKVFIFLISNAIEKIQQSDTSVIKLTIFGEFLEQALRSAGFVFRNEGEVFGVSTLNENLKSILYDENAWFLTDAEAHGESF